MWKPIDTYIRDNLPNVTALSVCQVPCILLLGYLHVLVLCMNSLTPPTTLLLSLVLPGKLHEYIHNDTENGGI